MVAPLLAKAGEAAVSYGVPAIMKGLGSFFGAGQESPEQKMQRQMIEEQRRRNKDARKYLSGYGYNPYQQKYLPGLDGMLSQYLSGGLTAGQQNVLDTSRATGMESINNAASSSNIVGGGRMALVGQLNRDLSGQALQMGTQNQQYGAGLAQELENFGLNDWIRGQDAGMRGKELMAQYA